MADLTARDREILDFAGQRWNAAGAKEQAIRDTFDMTATRYYQRLAALLDKPEALAYNAQLVNRLRRIRDARLQDRRRRMSA